MAKPIRYEEIIGYEDIDPFKVSAQAAAASTGHNLGRYGYAELPESRGESVFVWDEGDKYRVGVIEGLGTKNLVADVVDQGQPNSHYDAAAQDNIAMLVNDEVVSGARPQVLWIHLAAGSSEWFKNKERVEAFNLGCAAVCNELGITWAGGETPVLPGIIEPMAAEISGFVLGEIKPKSRYVSGDQLEDGDAIVLVGSSGIHANGVSAARRLSEIVPYSTTLPDGKTFGESLLRPTNLYVNFVQALLDERTRLKRMENITGHGWRKLMRAKQPYTYRIHELPPSLPIFDFLKEHLQADHAEMFGNYNMGAGFAVYTPQEEVEQVVGIANANGLGAWHGGNVERGPKQVILEPLKLIFKSETLKVR